MPAIGVKFMCLLMSTRAIIFLCAGLRWAGCHWSEIRRDGVIKSEDRPISDFFQYRRRGRIIIIAAGHSHRAITGFDYGEIPAVRSLSRRACHRQYYRNLLLWSRARLMLGYLFCGTRKSKLTSHQSLIRRYASRGNRYAHTQGNLHGKNEIFFQSEKAVPE